MNEPLFPSELSLDEESKYLKANLGLQKAMLLLEHCHQPDYQATLDSSLKALNDDLSWRQADGRRVVVLTAASMKKVLTMVLSACFDVSKEKTIAKMRARFAVMNAQLSSEHEEHQQERLNS